MELQNNVPIPGEEPEAPVEAARKKIRAKGKVKSLPTVAASLINALRFLAPAQRGKASPFCMISGHWAAASNGVLTIGHPIEEDLAACAHTGQLIEALLKCKEELNITQLSAEAISVNSGVFRAVIPCVGFDQIQFAGPDANIAAIDNRIKDALANVVTVVADTADTAWKTAVLLQAGSAVGTNGSAILEYWHGIDLPPGMLIPRAAAVAISKAGLPLVGFGYSGATVTFHFEGGAFIKTALFNEQFPNYQPIFPPESNPLPIPEGFFAAVKTIAKFSQDGIVYFNEGKVSSAQVETEASTYRLEDLSQGMAFNAKYLLAVEHAFQRAEFSKATNRAIFFGNNVRGVLVGVDLKPAPNAIQTEESDDIPF